MRTIFLLIVVFLSPIFISGQESVIQPLSVGSYWTFVDSFYQDNTLYVDTSKVEVTGDTIISYQNNYLNVFFWQWEGDDEKWLLRNQDDGLWCYGFSRHNSTTIDPELALKFPASVGDTWYSWSLLGDSIECVDTDTLVNTPAGSFISYVYSPKVSSKEIFPKMFMLRSKHLSSINYNTKSNYMKLFFSPNNGYVQFFYQDEYGYEKKCLLSYNIVSNVERTNHPKSNFLLLQNYPNPFNPTTTISYVVPSAGTRHLSLQLVVYDALGRKVATLVNKKQRTGEYSVQFNANNLPSGVYFYTLRTGNFVQTRKMVLLK